MSDENFMMAGHCLTQFTIHHVHGVNFVHALETRELSSVAFFCSPLARWCPLISPTSHKSNKGKKSKKSIVQRPMSPTKGSDSRSVVGLVWWNHPSTLALHPGVPLQVVLSFEHPHPIPSWLLKRSFQHLIFDECDVGTAAPREFTFLQ